MRESVGDSLGAEGNYLSKLASLVYLHDVEDRIIKFK
jgi:hypothetical protein